jgi:hypothetical protein
MELADIPCPAVTAPTSMYAMGCVIQTARCPYDFRVAASKIITIVPDAATIERASRRRRGDCRALGTAFAQPVWRSSAGCGQAQAEAARIY